MHSDNTLLSFEYKRIGLATSLNLPTGLAPDALRRTLHVQVEDSGENPDLEGLWETYNEIKPKVLGAIFTVIAAILAHLGKAQAEDLADIPEMSDFARRLKSADMAFPKLVLASEPGGKELELYRPYRRHTIEILVAAGLENQLVLLILAVMDGKEGGKPFTRSPALLLTDLRQAAVRKGLHVDISQPWFPANEKQLGHRMTEMHKVLVRLGHRGTRPPDQPVPALRADQGARRTGGTVSHGHCRRRRN